ncbi:MAG: toll/interleukin-1 receptor domain-containing protein [Anaerolineae bacterium]
MDTRHNQPQQAESEWLVFISHAGTDTWVAKRLSEQIEACGAKTFLDEAHIAVGEDFEERILHALDQADELLVILTPWSLKRLYVWAEIGAVWGKRKPIVGVLYGLTPEELYTQADVPVLIKRRDLIDINQLDQYLSQLQERIRGRI